MLVVEALRCAHSSNECQSSPFRLFSCSLVSTPLLVLCRLDAQLDLMQERTAPTTTNLSLTCMLSLALTFTLLFAARKRDA